VAAQCLADELFAEAWSEILAWMMCRFASEINVRGWCDEAVRVDFAVLTLFYALR
jgi:hypothetical protein